MPKRLWDEQYYAALAKRIRAGDEDAFAELYTNTWQDLSRYACYILKDTDLVPDALQEVYIAVYKNIDKLKLDTLLLPWMRQITYHECIDAVRRQRANREINSDFERDGYLIERAALQNVLGYDGRGAFEAADARELRSHLSKALASLPVRERQAFLLRYEYDLKLEEIADFLGCSLATAKRCIASAREQLQGELEHLRAYA